MQFHAMSRNNDMFFISYFYNNKLKDDSFYQECSTMCRENYVKSLYNEKNFVPYITDIFESL